MIVSPAASAAEFAFVQPASLNKPLTYAEAAELIKKAATLANFVITPDAQDPELDIIKVINLFTQSIGQYSPSGSIAAVPIPNGSAIIITEYTSRVRQLIDLKKELDKPPPPAPDP